MYAPLLNVDTFLSTAGPSGSTDQLKSDDRTRVGWDVSGFAYSVYTGLYSIGLWLRNMVINGFNYCRGK
jgi:hypothetical protein